MRDAIGSAGVGSHIVTADLAFNSPLEELYEIVSCSIQFCSTFATAKKVVREVSLDAPTVM